MCAEACPVESIAPAVVLVCPARKEFEKHPGVSTSLTVSSAVACSYACPSNIPLVQYYRAAKSEIRAAQKAQLKSDRARIRFEFRERRLQQKKQQEEERRRLKREALQKKKAGGDASAQADPVQAALERVKARKQAGAEEESL